MARTARKRPDSAKSTAAAKHEEPTSEATDTKAEPITEAPDPTSATGDVVESLKVAYWRAIDDRDPITGSIPAAPLDAVKVAYRAVPKRIRGDVATALGAEAAQKMVRPDGIDAGLAVAMGHLSALFAQVNAERSVRQPATPHDPVSGVAGILAILDQAREGVLGNLSDEQRERVPTVDVASDPAAQEAGAATLAALAKISARVLNGRKRSTRAATGERSPGAPGRDLGQLLRDEVAGSPNPIGLGLIARKHGVSTGALDNRWTKENTEGVLSVRDADGHKAFQAA